MTNNNLPPKIANLYLLREAGFNVPPFYVLNEKSVTNIENEIENIKSFFKREGVENIIIRSASFLEDLVNKSLAGFFETSAKISVENLKIEDIKKLWLSNTEKLKINNHKKPFYLFIQQFCEFDFSGVLFTQEIYDEKKAILKLSKKSFEITSGSFADETFTCNKENGEWEDRGGILNEKVKKELVALISFTEKTYSQGTDIELGIEKDKLYLLQARPITRNEDEKILLLEKKRLVFLFGENFKEQLWLQDNLTYALGDLSFSSLNLYNWLLCSEELNKLLFESKFIGRKASEIKNLRILENIGNRTYFNLTQSKEVFPQEENFLAKLKNNILIRTYESFVKQENEGAKKEKKSIKEAFAWLFLSGAYFQFFLEQEKKIYKKDFTERLRNAEILAGATQPFLKKEEDFQDFVKNFYYLSDYPYEITSPRITEMDKKELVDKFKKVAPDRGMNPSKNLGQKIFYWLKEKIYWKEVFLKILTEERKDLINKFYSENIVSDYKISSRYQKISGRDYPFSRDEISSQEVIIVPGEIDYDNLFFLKENDDISKYRRKYIAVDKFPASWISFIPELKGLITREGNELSHVAITCREYEIPYFISPKFF